MVNDEHAPGGEDYIGKERELCFGIHDPDNGDLRKILATEGVGHWNTRRVKLPLLSVIPIVPQRSYRVEFTLHPSREVYDVRMDGFLIAEDVPFHTLVVAMTRYVEPQANEIGN